MEFTLDVSRVREILNQEYRQSHAAIRERGVLAAVEESQRRHDERLASAVDSGSLACRSGCSWCCHFTVDVRAAEVFGILDFVERHLTSEQRERIYREARANSVVFGALSEPERATRNVKCPFLSDGQCVVYSVRPQSCRNFHATDASGCQRSYEEPLDLDIDPEFAPGVYQAGQAHVEAFSAALRAGGYDTRAYELNGAIDAALADASARARFEAREVPFLGLHGLVVEEQFDDLWP